MAWYNSSKDLGNKLTPSKPVQKAVMTAVDPGGVIRKVGDLTGTRGTSIQGAIDTAGTAANKVVDAAKSGVQAVGSAVGGINPMDMFGAAGFGGIMNQIWGREDKQKAEADKQRAVGLGLTQDLSTDDRYSDAAQQSAIDRRYQGMASLAKGQQNAASQGEQNVMSRRLAAMGGLNSGAGMKMLSQQQNLSNRRAADQNTQLGIAQSQEKQAATSDNQKLNETARQYDNEFKLNERIADANIKMGDSINKANNQGMITSLWSSIFGKDLSSVGGVTRKLQGK